VFTGSVSPIGFAISRSAAQDREAQDHVADLFQPRYKDIDGVTYLAGEDIITFIELRIRNREARRHRRVTDEPAGTRDPDPGPFMAYEVAAALRKGLGLKEVR
jgi:hypothetical protein